MNATKVLVVCIFSFGLACGNGSRQASKSAETGFPESNANSSLDDSENGRKREVKAFAVYSNTESVGEGWKGHDVSFWKYRGNLVGLCGGSSKVLGNEEGKNSFIENVDYSEKTGAISFDCRSEPEGFAFAGYLSDEELKGTIAAFKPDAEKKKIVLPISFAGTFSLDEYDTFENFEKEKGIESVKKGDRQNSLNAAASEGPAAKNIAVRTVGAYSNVWSDGEHQNGFVIDLWLHGDRMIGSASGSFDSRLVGDPPMALLRDLKYDKKSGAISFFADIRGQYLRFEGVLIKKVGMKGVLTREMAGYRSATVNFARDDWYIYREDGYETLEAWQKEMDRLLRRRG
ncbi:MAG: hypothetical protein R2684_15905 [Pyrinomonadaceae bacterium]